MFTRPGKKLLFMGTELAPSDEWNHDTESPLASRRRSEPRGVWAIRRAARAALRAQPAFWRDDSDVGGFRWIDVADKENSVLSYVRRSGDSRAIVVLNLTPMPRERYRIGVPEGGRYECRALDRRCASGAEAVTDRSPALEADESPFHGCRTPSS